MKMMRPALVFCFLAALLAQPNSIQAADGKPNPPARQAPKYFHHGARVMTVAFSPDGKILATGGQDGAICLWEVLTGKRIRRIVAYRRSGAGVFRVVFRAYGKTLISSGGRGWGGPRAIRFWNMASGKQMRQIDVGTHGVSVLALSPDGKHLVYGGNGALFYMEVKSGKRLHRLPTKAVADSAAFSPDGKTLAAAEGDWQTRLYDLRTGKGILCLNAQQIVFTGSQAVAFSPDGKMLATAGGRSGTVRLWQSKTGKELGQFKAGGCLWGVCFGPQGKKIAGLENGNLRVWDVATKKLLWSRQGRFYVRCPPVFSSDGKWLAMGGDNGAILFPADGMGR